MQPGDALPAGYALDRRYKINKVIGLGGMGRVYLANDTRLANRPVAVKEMIVGSGLAVKKAVEDFAREAEVLSRLSHPGIPSLFDNFVENQRHYLVMEFVAGGDLQAMLDKLGVGARIPEPTVLRWAHQILDVLEFLHAQKPPIVYRDLKPANIMIDHKNSRAMIIDFGIARFLPPGGRGTQIGSVGYAPPEQYTGKVEPRSDLYSLAATMHHLLSGRDPQLEPPFSFPALRQLAPQVSAGTDRVVMRALEREIDKRPASAIAMGRELPAAPEGEDQFASRVGSAPAANSSRLGAPSIASTAATVVLLKSTPSDSALAGSPPARPRAGSGSRMPTQRSLKVVPKRKAASGSARVSSTAKTQDLKKPVQAELELKSEPRASAVKSVPVAEPATERAPNPLPVPEAASPTPVSPARSNAPASASSDCLPAAGGRLIAKSEGAQFLLTGSRMVIGRTVDSTDAPDVDLANLKNRVDRVSRRHAEIIRNGLDYYIRDLGSLNGTYITGRGRLGRDQLYKLKDRDEVVLGGARLEFRKD